MSTTLTVCVGMQFTSVVCVVFSLPQLYCESNCLCWDAVYLSCLCCVQFTSVVCVVFSLPQLLLKPSERIAQYVVLLSAFRAHTPPDHADQADLKAAITTLHELNSLVQQVCGDWRESSSCLIANSIADKTYGPPCNSLYSDKTYGPPCNSLYSDKTYGPPCNSLYSDKMHHVGME